MKYFVLDACENGIARLIDEEENEQQLPREDLPAEARAKLKVIKSGGPFAYKEDGVAFRNREKKLPIKRRGFYRVYVVPTPGVKGLGKRRIISGCAEQGKCQYWYTSDDYEVLHRIRE